MSQNEIARFAEMALKNQELKDRLLKDAADAQAFIRNVVAASKEQGFGFTEEEAAIWFAEQDRCHTTGELTDLQLEAVAGGWGWSWPRFNWSFAWNLVANNAAGLVANNAAGFRR